MLGLTRARHGFRTLLCGLVLALMLGSASVGTAAVPFGMSLSAPARVPILVYHTVDESGNTYSITPRQLNQQCRWLVEHGYTSITLRQFWRAARGLDNVSPLTRRQIRSLAERGSVEAHTVSHVALSGLAYKDQVAEIAENRAYLEEITGKPVRFLAWPYGDVSESAIEAAETAGIVASFALDGTVADLDTTDRYTIPRITIFVNDDLETFAAKVTGT
ncbi:MAG: polysaccharide deacetylase [Thermomicrobiales bacterium]|nr:polysaccharide deacetylase [Thermomicrobiales bacterium]